VLSGRPAYRRASVLLALALVAPACGGGEDNSAGGGSGDETIAEGEETEGATDTEGTESERLSGGTVVVGLEAEAVGLRPWADSCTSPCYNMMVTIYDKLMEINADGEYVPFLAESIEPNADFTTWTMTLRDGVSFHNGTELTAQTIADMFPIQQAGAAGSSAISGANLEAVEAVDDLTVEYILSSPNSALPASLNQAGLGMPFDPAAAAADPDGYSTEPIGTGPFTMDTRDLDNETVVIRNPDYWQTDESGTQLPYLDEIVFRPIPDEGTRLDSLLSGTVDVMQTLRQGTVRDAREAEGIELYEFQGNNTSGGIFNTAIAPFDDVRVRRGLIMVNDQAAVTDALGGTGISLPATQWFSPDSPWYSEAAAEAYPGYDPEAGAALLQEYVDDPERSDGKAPGEPISVELSCPPDPSLVAAMQVGEQSWTSTGLVEVELTHFDQQTHINRALGAPPDFVGDHGAHCWRVGGDLDPSLLLNFGFAPPDPATAQAIGLPGMVSPQNFSNYFDEELFQNLQAAIRTDDFDERKALYEAVMVKLAEDVPGWYSGHTATLIAAVPEVKGFDSWTTPDGDLGIGFPTAEARWHQIWRTDAS
jgi:peptide/nickel transport system substrate-binding protein